MISSTSQVSSYSVNATANPIRYHTTEARHLLATTLAGLDGNGIPSSLYGSRRDGKFILRGGDYLTPHARSVLPMHMGGESFVIPTTLDDRTVTFLDKANAMSPAGFKGHTQSVRTRVVPLHAHFDAEEGDDMPPPAHVGSDASGGGGGWLSDHWPVWS